MSCHASTQRGLTTTPNSNLPQGRFGRMFRNLPPAHWPEAMLKDLAKEMIGEGPDVDNKVGESDAEENHAIPAGYTYLGQFLDHDITFDPQSSLEKLNDPDALIDFRTPRFDLDSCYGRGPEDQPYLYRGNTREFFIPKDGDLPRAEGRDTALIGDPRNDENRIVSQLHVAFLGLHNAIMRRLAPRIQDVGARFHVAQQQTRWHYQWMILHDFLPRICGKDTVQDILQYETFTSAGRKGKVLTPRLLFYHWNLEPFMPVEFSGAVYRFGHSMVRPSYHLNRIQQSVTEQRDKKNTDPADPKQHVPPNRVAIFSDTPAGGAEAPEDLRGFCRPPVFGKGTSKEWNQHIEWRFFFEMESGFHPQSSYKIDTQLVEPLAFLNKVGVVDENDTMPFLGLRNLMRGMNLGLPCGQDVARAMGLSVLTPAELSEHSKEGDKTAKLPPALAGIFGARTPLWYYVLREAELIANSKHLGPVGARIVAEVFIGLMAGDNTSYLNANPGWTPQEGVFQIKKDSPFDMPALIRAAQEGAEGISI